MWNVNRRTIDGQPRTLNNVEGWHSAITYSVLGLKQTHILKPIDGLKLEIGAKSYSKLKYKNGHWSTSVKKKKHNTWIWKTVNKRRHLRIFKR